MILKRFNIQIIFRVLLLTVTLFIFTFVLLMTEYYSAMIVAAIAVVYQVYALIRFIQRTNRDLKRFFETIRYGDFSQSFSPSISDSSFDDLYKEFNQVLDKFKDVRNQGEEKYWYLQMVIQHIGVGLIGFRANGEIELINNAARKIFGLGLLKSIDNLLVFGKDIVDTLFKIKYGEKRIVRITNGRSDLQLILYATEFVIREKKIKLVSFQNIRTELEEKEIQSWQILVRTLTHEIMNSVTPIASLSATVSEIIEEYTRNSSDLPKDEINDIREALHTIHRRSEGLINFVTSYRKLARIPKPNLEIVKIEDLFKRVSNLLNSQCTENNIALKWFVEPESLEITVDPELIEQVLINLIKNSIDALGEKESGTISLQSFIGDNGTPVIEVVDNGMGILPEVQEKIFIPFFTTKKNGSGIGLSLSRQIMHLHGGSINVSSEPDVETVFTLRF